MKIFITGDIGFIGLQLVKRLILENHEIIGFDKRKSMTRSYAGIQGNILDYQALVNAMPDSCDLIIHLAAEHADDIENVQDYYTVNGDGTENVLKAATEKKVSRFLFFSSVAVYGATYNADENMKPTPNNPYGESKLIAEKLIDKWVKNKSDRNAVIVRPTAVYGPGNKANIFRLFKLVYNKQYVQIGHGDNKKSIIFLENVAASVMFLLNNKKTGISVFNLIDYPQNSMKELTKILAKIANKRLFKIQIPTWLMLFVSFIPIILTNIFRIKMDVTLDRIKKLSADTYFSGDKIRTEGYIQGIETKDAIKKTYDWYLDKKWL